MKHIIYKFRYSLVTASLVALTLFIFLNTTTIPDMNSWPYEVEDNSKFIPNPQCAYEENTAVECSSDAIFPNVSNLSPSQYLFIQLDPSARQMNNALISPLGRFVNSMKLQIVLSVVIELYNINNETNYDFSTLPDSISYFCTDLCISKFQEVLGDSENIGEKLLNNEIKIKKINMSKSSRFDYSFSTEICMTNDQCKKMDEIRYKKDENGKITLFMSEISENGQGINSIEITPNKVPDSEDIYLSYKWEYISAPPDLDNNGIADFENEHGFITYRGLANSFSFKPSDVESGSFNAYKFKDMFITARVGSSNPLKQHKTLLYSLAKDENNNYSVSFKFNGIDENLKGCFSLDNVNKNLNFKDVSNFCSNHHSSYLSVDAVTHSYSMVSSFNWSGENPPKLDFNELSFSCKNFEDQEIPNFGCPTIVDVENIDFSFNEENKDLIINSLNCLYDDCLVEYALAPDCESLTGQEVYQNLSLGISLGLKETVDDWINSGIEDFKNTCVLLKAKSNGLPNFSNMYNDKIINPYPFYFHKNESLPDLPSCEEKSYISHSPIATDDLMSVVPLGNLNPPSHTFPAPHMYFYLKKSDTESNISDVANVYSVGSGVITSINSYEHVNKGFKDYRLNMSPCKEYSFYYGHVQTIALKLQEEINKKESSGESNCETYTTGGETYKNCSYTGLNINVEAGETIGTAGGQPEMYALDFGFVDYSKNPNSYASDLPLNSNDSSLLYKSCPLDLFDSDTFFHIKPFLGSWDGLIPRTAEPLCGEIAQDIADTSQGQWYLEGVNSYYPEDPHIALVHDNVDPTIGVFSLGSSIDEIGGSTYHFEPLFEGQYNRDFSEVTPGEAYCYHVKPYWKDELIPGAILIQMVSSTKIFLEYRKDFSCNDLSSFEIDESHSTVFVR